MQVLAPKFLLLCGLPILMVMIVLIASSATAAITKQEEDILQDYKPIGMDESVKVLKKGEPSFVDPIELASPESQVQPLLSEVSTTTRPGELPVDLPIEEVPPTDAGQLPFDKPVEGEAKLPQARSRHHKQVAADEFEEDFARNLPHLNSATLDKAGNLDGARVEAVNYTRQHKDSQQLWLVPAKEGRHLTRLITAKEPSTFLETKVAEPRMADTRDVKKRKLAQYTIMVPIWIPAVKKTKKIAQRKPEKVKYVKETHTEMVPVTKQVAVKKTIVKPERVAQKIVTDFVRAPEGGERAMASHRVDDEVRPNEEILGSVVTNYQ